MCSITARFTVYFEDPFWVGVIERVENGRLEAARIVFGAEPKDYEVYACLLKNYTRLRFSPPVAADREGVRRPNPKRMQRQIAAGLSQSGVGTKAQQALRQMHEAGKAERKARRKNFSAEQKQRKFELRQQKKKEKHRGG